jgi:hypothetical protein
MRRVKFHAYTVVLTLIASAGGAIATTVDTADEALYWQNHFAVVTNGVNQNSLGAGQGLSTTSVTSNYGFAPSMDSSLITLALTGNAQITFPQPGENVSIIAGLHSPLGNRAELQTIQNPEADASRPGSAALLIGAMALTVGRSRRGRDQINPETFERDLLSTCRARFGEVPAIYDSPGPIPR